MGSCIGRGPRAGRAIRPPAAASGRGVGARADGRREILGLGGGGEPASNDVSLSQLAPSQQRRIDSRRPDRSRGTRRARLTEAESGSVERMARRLESWRCGVLLVSGVARGEEEETERSQKVGGRRAAASFFPLAFFFFFFLPIRSLGSSWRLLLIGTVLGRS